MIDLYAPNVDLKLTRPLVVKVVSGARMEFDAGALPEQEPGVLIEAWAHQGPPKAAQRKKIIADAFKLGFAATLQRVRPRLVLLFSDPEAAAPFASPRAWSTAAFEAYGIEIIVVELLAEDRDLIRQAQVRQYR